MPLVGHAAVPDFFIYQPRLLGMSAIPSTAFGTVQTAVRAGDTPTFQVLVHHMNGDIPSVSADLSEFGLSNSATTSGAWVGYGALYYPAYFYNFGPLSVATDTPDGVHVVSITATNVAGGVATATTSIVVDNLKPIVSLSGITFSTTSPKHGDYLYLSGRIDGTGSAARVPYFTTYLTDASGNPVVSTIAGGSGVNYDSRELNAALATSTDGSFSNVPVRLLEFGDIGWIARAANLTVRINAYDEAGNIAHGDLTVPIPKTIPPDPCIASDSCVSNVMFLPGIEGSRLYEGTGCGKTAEEKLWEPIDSMMSIVRGAGDGKVADLALDASGASACADIYTKTGDVIDKTMAGNLYQSLIDEMNGLVASSTIHAWKPVAYDWRLSLDDLLAKGAERDGKVYYEEATTTPYIEQTLRALAATSKTGKVTVVAHSNGGLVAKALLHKLGDAAASALVDKVILVAVPQTGAPSDVASMLVGYGAGIYKYNIPIVSNKAARAFVQNSPMAYHLLPSEDYLESTAGDANHPVIRFSGDGYSKELDAYGSTIVNRVALDNFLLAREGGRTKPDSSDLASAEILRPELVDYANATHATLDVWTPPAGIEVDEIAGWGVDTVAGIDFYTTWSLFGPLRHYRPLFVEDGDGTVPVPSALMMATSSANVNRYWVDLAKINDLPGAVRRSHGDIFEVPSLGEFINNLIENSTSTLPDYISSTQPPPVTDTKKITFFLHSPLTLELTDSSGNTTGLATDGSIVQNIPGATYGEFGEVKYIIAPAGGDYQLTMHGQASGTFSLDIQESSGGVVTALSTIANVPTTPATLASLTISGGISDASPLTVDESGDGEEIITLAPLAGKTVNYESPVVELAPATTGAGAGGPPPIYLDDTTEVVTTTEPELSMNTETTVEVVATTSLEVVATTTVSTSTPRLVGEQPKLVVRDKKPQKVVEPEKKSAMNIPQTASVYDASQQPLLKQIGEAVYNGIHGLWKALKGLFW